VIKGVPLAEYAAYLDDRAKVARLLEPERIGVELSEEMQLDPEQSTDAIVIHHPAARYFSV
jgi:5-methyltetrahydrofolate--homocysteine methyltransferase